MADGAIGIIGGSGLYALEGLSDVREVRLQTPFGEPSDAYVTGSLSGRRLVFLPRHGRGHRHLPTEVNSRANIYGMKSLGVEWILAVSAVGSLQESIPPGELVVPDQLIDRTREREATFFGRGCVAHVQFGDPFCPGLRGALLASARAAGAKLHDGGTYVCMEGPAFSTRAESALHRSWGASIIGMTAIPEAKLAREAEICYAILALATDYDCWHREEVSVEAVLSVIRSNVEMSKRIVRELVGRIPERTCRCPSALQHAVMTDPKTIPPQTRKKLGLFLDKYWT